MITAHRIVDEEFVSSLPAMERELVYRRCVAIERLVWRTTDGKEHAAVVRFWLASQVMQATSAIGAALSSDIRQAEPQLDEDDEQEITDLIRAKGWKPY